ncbi:MAG: beta strand repeat-containing protein, partial [Acidobacteriota bacterium]
MISSGINNLARTAGVAKTAADGGPVILDGMDPVWHAVNGENTYIYIGKSLKSIYDLSNGRTNNDKIAVLGTSPTDAGATGGNWSTMMSTKFLTTFGTQPQYDIYSTEAELNAFFSTQIDAASPPRMIWLPDIGGSNTNNRETVFQANAAKIAEFVNNGGGLFANMGQYLWLSKLIPGAVYNGGGCNGGPAVTTVGSTDFGLQDSDVVSCWHGWFTNYGTSLQPLVDWPYPSNSSPRVAVSIGGGSVTLPTNFTLTGTPSSPLIGSTLSIKAKVLDGNDVPQVGLSVTLEITSGPGAGDIFAPVTTNAAGEATFTHSNSVSGVSVYKATTTINAKVKTVTSSITWTAGPATTLAMTTQPVAGVSGASLGTQPVVELRNTNGFRTTSTAAVTVAIQSGSGGTLGGTTTVNAVNGVATFTNLTLAGVVGTNYVLRFSATGLTTVDSANVAVTGPGVATQLALTTAPVSGASGAVFATQPVVTIRDSAGNAVTGSTAAVTVAIQSGTGGTLGGTTTVNAVNGVATFSGLSLAGTVGTNYVLRFSGAGLTVDTGNMTVTPGTATQLVLTTAPVASASGTALATQPVLAIKDAQGNTVTSATGAVTVAIQSGTGGTLGGTKTVNAVAGVATFSGLTLTGSVGTNYVLRFTSPGLTLIDSGNLSVTPGGATTLALTTAPVTGASGAVFSTQPVVAIKDAQGNTATVSTAAVTVAIQSGTGGTLGGTTTVNAVAGVATFSGLSLTGKVGTT